MGGSSMELSCSSSRLRSACSLGQVRRLCPEPPQYPQRCISAALSGTWHVHEDKGGCWQTGHTRPKCEAHAGRANSTDKAGVEGPQGHLVANILLRLP